MNIDYEFSTVDGVHYQKEEISQIEKGFAHGLTEEQVKIYVNPYFSDLDMKLIRKGIEHNFADEEIKERTPKGRKRPNVARLEHLSLIIF